MEEEILISSLQPSDFSTDANGSLSRTMNRSSSKENIDSNAQLSGQDSKIVISEVRSGEDDLMLNEEKLSKLIEGDFSRPRKPTPRPRRETGISNAESLPIEDCPDKSIFSSRKDSADKFLSASNNSANQFFSGSKEAAVDNETKGNLTSPRPIPRPRSKEKASDELNKQKSPFQTGASDSNKFSTEKRFDSLEKSSKSVSFVDANENQKNVPQRQKSFEKILSNDRIPPTKSPRNKKNSKIKRSSDESDSEIKVSKGEKGPRPKQRHRIDKEEMFSEDSAKDLQNNLEHRNRSQHPGQHLVDHNIQALEVSTGHHYGEYAENSISIRTDQNGISHLASDGMELFDSRKSPNRSRAIPPQQQKHFALNGDGGVEQSMSTHDVMPQGRGTPGWAERDNLRDDWNYSCSNYNNLRGEDKEYVRNTSDMFKERGWEDSTPNDNSGHSRSQNEHDSHSIGSGYDRKGDITDTFEEHVPANNGIVQDGEDNRKNKYYRRRPSGKEIPMRSPMRAQKGLNEMSKSPDIYNFPYESRDYPQDNPYLQSKGTFARNKRPSSLMDLHNWENMQGNEQETFGSPISPGFSSSRGIRDAVYAEWLERKRGTLKEAVRKKVEEKRKEEEKMKEKEEKGILAKKAFEAWSSKKEEVTKTEIKKKKETKNKKLDGEREKIIKKQDAKKYFESWKCKKDEVLKQSYKEKREKEKLSKQMKIEDHKQKIAIAKKSYDKWKSRKDEQLKKEGRSARQAEKLKTEYEKEAEMEKRQECEKTFQEFLRKKGTGRRPPPSPTLTQRAWCPGGITKGSNLIPEKVQPVIIPPTLNRSRSFSGPTRIITSLNGTKRPGRGW